MRTQQLSAPDGMPCSRLAVEGSAASVLAKAACSSASVYLRGAFTNAVLLREPPRSRSGFEFVCGWTQLGDAT